MTAALFWWTGAAVWFALAGFVGGLFGALAYEMARSARQVWNMLRVVRAYRPERRITAKMLLNAWLDELGQVYDTRHMTEYGVTLPHNAFAWRFPGPEEGDE